MVDSSWMMVHSRSFKRVAFPVVIAFFSVTAEAQSAFKGLEPLFTQPENYVVYHTDHPPAIDGNINKPVWQQAVWSNEFVDIEGAGKPKPTFPTKVKMLWDDSCLYIAAQITDPQVWATLKHHDDIVFNDNDFEVFVDPNNTGQPYFEIETNAFDTIFDLLLYKPYRDGGRAVINWDLKSLRSAVKIQGTINNTSDQDQGWTVEMAIPFKSISVGNTTQFPQDGTLWRINFSRVEWDIKAENNTYIKQKDNAGRPLPEHNWVWSPQGVINMHYPERWGYLQFSRQPANSVTFNLPYAEQQKQYLWLIYYRQMQWFSQHNSYAATLHELGVDESENINKKQNTLKLEATTHQFMALITDSENKILSTYTINQEGLTGIITSHPDE